MGVYPQAPTDRSDGSAALTGPLGDWENLARFHLYFFYFKSVGGGKRSGRRRGEGQGERTGLDVGRDTHSAATTLDRASSVSVSWSLSALTYAHTFSVAADFFFVCFIFQFLSASCCSLFPRHWDSFLFLLQIHREPICDHLTDRVHLCLLNTHTHTCFVTSLLCSILLHSDKDLVEVFKTRHADCMVYCNLQFIVSTTGKKPPSISALLQAERRTRLFGCVY